MDTSEASFTGRIQETTKRGSRIRKSGFGGFLCQVRSIFEPSSAQPRSKERQNLSLGTTELGFSPPKVVLMTGEFSKTSVAAPITLLQYDEPTQRAEAPSSASPVLKKQCLRQRAVVEAEKRSAPGGSESGGHRFSF